VEKGSHPFILLNLLGRKSRSTEVEDPF